MSIESMVREANLTAPQVDAMAAAIKQAMMKEVQKLAEERGEDGYAPEGPPQPMPPAGADPGMQAPPYQPQPGQQQPGQMGPPGGQPPPQPQPDEIIRRQMMQAAQRGGQPGILNRMG